MLYTKKTTLKQALSHDGLVPKKVNKVIEPNQKAWLKPYIGMITETSTKINGFEKYFFNLVNNSVFGKTIRNLRKHRDIKNATTEQLRSHLMSHQNYRITQKL